MKYYINHCEIFKTCSTWEVEADSFEEAVRKLNRAGEEDIELANIMTDPINNYVLTGVEDHLAQSPNDYTPYSLADYIKENTLAKEES